MGREQAAQLRAIVGGLDQSVFAFRKDVATLADDASLSDAQKVLQIKGLLATTEPPDIEQLKSDLAEGGDERLYYELLEKQ